MRRWITYLDVKIRHSHISRNVCRRWGWVSLAEEIVAKCRGGDCDEDPLDASRDKILSGYAFVQLETRTLRDYYGANSLVAGMLTTSSVRGREGRVKARGSSRWPRLPTRAYHIHRAKIQILAVPHAAQRWPTRFITSWPCRCESSRDLSHLRPTTCHLRSLLQR